MLFDPVAAPNIVMRMYGARALTPSTAPGLCATLNTLASRTELDFMPKLFYLPSGIVNAFAVGRGSRSAIVVSDDMWILGIADVFSRATNVLSLFGQLLLVINLPLAYFTDVSIDWTAILLLILAPHLNALAQLGLSRTREYNADLGSAWLTGDAQGLSRALVEIERRQRPIFERFMFPDSGNPNPSLLRTHPPTKERVSRLTEISTPHEPFEWDPRNANRPIAIRPTRRHLSGLWF